MPSTLRINMPLAQSLRYGENPHQRAALYSDGSGLGIAGATQLQGKELSFNNLVDLDACWELAQEFDEPAVIIVKHTNPCGAATGATMLEAYQKALASDPVSAFGGVIGINRPVDAEAAAEIAKLFVEAIAAPHSPPKPANDSQPKRICDSSRSVSLRHARLSNTFPAACFFRMPTPAASPKTNSRSSPGVLLPPKNSAASSLPGASANTSNRTPSSTRVTARP